MGPFAVTFEDVTNLNAYQLTELLRRLLILESAILGLATSAVSVSLNINIPDGGEDGRLEWKGGPEPAETSWIKRRLSVFQVKATNMHKSDCAKEIVTKGNAALKPRVKDVVCAGAYVLFLGRSCEGQAVTEREGAIRQRIADHTSATEAENTVVVVYGAEKIAEWANEHGATIAYVLQCVGRAVPATMQTWKGWEAEHPTNLTFHVDGARREVLDLLRGHLQAPQAIARLVGLSGLGKSRLALEAFRHAGDGATEAEQRALSASCVYVSDGDRVDQAVISTLRAMKSNGTRAVVVVDECPLRLHETLERIVGASDSSLSLLTLDYDPSGNPESSRCEFRVLGPLNLQDVEALLRASDLELPEEQVSKVASLAQGFPRMAELLADAIVDSDSKLWKLEPLEAYRRLVVRRSDREEEVWAVAKALSTLEHLGTDGDVKDQLPAFAAKMCERTPNEVYGVIKELEKAGIAYRRGDWVRMTPLPLAVALAAEWWEAKWEAYELLTKDHLPPDMVDAIARQLVRLKGHPFADKLMHRLYGPNGPFRTRDFLDSAHGSRVTNSLAEVSPKAVSGALYGTFSSDSPDEARNVSNGRRHLVWALETIAWWPDTFHEAAWLLLLFAAGENEQIGNNATTQLLQLFHLQLSGTETPALDRLGVLDRGLKSPYPEMQGVCVHALLAALDGGHFRRSWRAESQGLGPPREDWNPSTYGEIWNYWRAVIARLSPFLMDDGELGSAAREGVANRVRGLIRQGGLDIVTDVIDAVLETRSEWPEMLDGLRTAFNYDSDDYPADILRRVQALVERLEPKDLGERLSYIVSNPTWNELRREDDGSVTVIAEERAEELANDVASNPGILLGHWSRLLKGEQRQGFVFGRQLAGRVSDPRALLEDGLAAIEDVPASERNAAVLAGIASVLANNDLAWLRSRRRALFAEPDMRIVAIDLMRAGRMDDDDVLLMAVAVEQGDLEPGTVSHLALGGVLHPISGAVVSRLVLACMNSEPHGEVVALTLLGMKLHRSRPAGELRTCALSLTREARVLEAAAAAAGMPAHHFEIVVDLLLTDVGADYVMDLTTAVLATLRGESWLSQLPRVLLQRLLLAHPGTAWPLVMASCSTSDEPGLHKLIMGLEQAFGERNVVEAVGDDALAAWVDDVPEVGGLVGRIINPLRQPVLDDPYPRWTALSQTLLERHGADDGLRSGLAASIYSGGWSGSAVPRLLEHRAAYLELKSHPMPEVADWTRRHVESLDERIEQERKRDEEEDFGIYR